MSVLSLETQQQVQAELVREGVITQEALEQIRHEAEKSNEPLFSLLMRQGHVNNESFTRALATVNKVPYVNLTADESRVDAKVLELLPHDVAERFMAVPLGEVQNRLAVAMLDTSNVQAIDFLSNKIGMPIKVYMASEEGIKRILAQYRANISSSTVGLSPQASAEEHEVATEDAKKVKTIVQDSPISKALSAILEFAARNRASDIHIEPLPEELKIRCRIDGVLREVMKLPKQTEAPLVSRIKILSNLKIDEHRTPQDGQFTVDVADKQIDLRIAISPTVWGEQVVIRLLDKSGTSLHLEEMGYTGRALRCIREGLQRPNGMILTSGPTGSGKSTSLYALLQEIKNDSINIVTLEDPVEYKMAGVNQIQVNADVGLTFATGLRSILRQDPDVVMVGEIRDKETATLAVQAALTGHLVFSTLHTNSAAGILPRLLDMGIEPFLIASTVHTVIGQRLVRRIAPNVREAYQATQIEVDAIHKNLAGILPPSAADVAAFAADHGYSTLPLMTDSAYTLFRGKDGPETPGGYKGRLGLYEVFNVSDQIQQLILKRATSSEIQRAAQSEGMIAMHQDGYLKALAGMTTLSEVNRVAAADSA